MKYLQKYLCIASHDFVSYNQGTRSYLGRKNFVESITVIAQRHSRIRHNIIHIYILIQINNELALWVNFY